MSEAIFTAEYYIVAPVSRVWEALLEPEIISRYYLAPPLILEPQSGGKIAYGYEGQPLIEGVVCRFEPLKAFEHTFRFIHAEAEETTRVLYTLEAVGEAVTRLIVTHSGFQSTEEPVYIDISRGWPSILSSLKTLLESGVPIPCPQ